MPWSVSIFGEVATVADISSAEIVSQVNSGRCFASSRAASTLRCFLAASESEIT